MNGKVTDSAVEAAQRALYFAASPEATEADYIKDSLDEQEDAEDVKLWLRAALEAALSHLHPQPAELAEQQELISDIYKVAGTPGMTPVDLADWVRDALLKDGHVIAATGKQQAGDDCQSCKGSGEGRAIAGSGPDVYEVDALCSACGGTGAPAQKVGEVQAKQFQPVAHSDSQWIK